MYLSGFENRKFDKILQSHFALNFLQYISFPKSIYYTNRGFFLRGLLHAGFLRFISSRYLNMTKQTIDIYSDVVFV